MEMTKKYKSPISDFSLATEIVYDWLDRDYTPSAIKTDTFVGDNTQCYAPRNRIGTLISWTATDNEGNGTNFGIDDLILRANGYLIQIAGSSTKSFLEINNKITYQQPSTLECPEAIKQVIRELHEKETYGLTERHKEILRPYRRY